MQQPKTNSNNHMTVKLVHQRTINFYLCEPVNKLLRTEKDTIIVRLLQKYRRRKPVSKVIVNEIVNSKTDLERK